MNSTHVLAVSFKLVSKNGHSWMLLVTKLYSCINKVNGQNEEEEKVELKEEQEEGGRKRGRRRRKREGGRGR